MKSIFLAPTVCNAGPLIGVLGQATNSFVMRLLNRESAVEIKLSSNEPLI